MVKIITETHTKTADPSLWKLKDSGPTAAEPARDRPLNLGDSCVIWSFVRHLAVGPVPIPDAWAGSLEPIPYSGVPYSALVQRGGA